MASEGIADVELEYFGLVYDTGVECFGKAEAHDTEGAGHPAYRHARRVAEPVNTEFRAVVAGLLHLGTVTREDVARINEQGGTHPAAVLDQRHGEQQLHGARGLDVATEGLGFADVLRRTKRETDAVGRFGGEEFVLVCEETDATGAEQLAERIRAELSTTTFHAAQGPLAVTCSVGVATFPQAGGDWEALFKATDEALYVSKRSGRNRVTVWTAKMRGAAA